MNRINQLFSIKRHDILSIYFCAGDPYAGHTADMLQVLASRGVDMVEIGIPFSDPMADGPVIQDAATRALRHGMTLRKLFSELRDVRTRVDIPLILMGYLNPILQYGFERFCQDCRQCGIDGVIIPDLPFREYMDHFRSTAEACDLKVIMLITPETEPHRIREIDAHTDGFIYLVSSAATTGAQTGFGNEQQAYFRRIAAMQLHNPCLIGFGISNRQTYEAASEHAAGCIIGSRFVSLLKEYDGHVTEAIDRLLADIGRTLQSSQS